MAILYLKSKPPLSAASNKDNMDFKSVLPFFILILKYGNQNEKKCTAEIISPKSTEWNWMKQARM